MKHCKTQRDTNRSRAEQGSLWLPALILFLTVAALAAAVWQWQRSNFHQALAMQAKAQLTSGHWLDLNGTSDANRVGAARVQGQWLENSTVFVTPRIQAGQMGAWVVSVLRYTSQGQTRNIGVHRGWVAQKSVMQKPDLISLVSDTVVLHGNVVPALGRAFELSLPNYSELGLWQNHDLAAHSKLLGVQLDDRVLVLSPLSPDVEAKILQRDNPVTAEKLWQDKADKNLGYAVQWLGLGGVGLFGLAWMLRNHRKSSQ